MHELLWLDHLPNNTLEGGIALANQLYWNITLIQGDQNKLWYVKGGEKIILKSDSHEVIEAFLYGLGLAYSVLPEEVFEQLRQEVQKWVE